ncbi:MAG: hypothetical protein AAB702_01170 [Patescibacteria group bacterium]
MVERTIGGRSAAEIVERAQSIQKGHYEAWRAEVERTTPHTTGVLEPAQKISLFQLLIINLKQRIFR